jgi:serine/threonine protein kinase
MIGEGNFGVVYKGQQLFLGKPARPVAIKICKHDGITPETARDVFGDAFLLAEAMDEMTSSEAKSHLVHVYDVSIAPEINGLGYLVMEYVRGTNLEKQFGTDRRISASQLLKWMRQACVTIEGLHTLNPPIIHRDLKPDNVLLGVDLSVRLVDFGLSARLLSLGIVPGVAGTLKYMAPETTQGKSVPASDVYSIGLMLYRGLTGKLPFDHLVPPLDLHPKSHGPWLYQKKKTYKIAPPSALNNTVSPPLDTIVLRCLAFEPEERYHNAQALRQALDTPDSTTMDWKDVILETDQLFSLKHDDKALSVLEQALKNPSHPSDGRFYLLRQRGRCLENLKKPLCAAKYYEEAWELVEESAILKNLQERAELLRTIAHCYGTAGNPYLKNRYENQANSLFAPENKKS